MLARRELHSAPLPVGLIEGDLLAIHSGHKVGGVAFVPDEQAGLRKLNGCTADPDVLFPAHLAEGDALNGQ